MSLEKLTDFKDGKVAIFTHPTPDPDAIGSALGVQWILAKKYGISSDIFYSGEISHAQNRTMVNVLGITLKKVSVFEENKGDYSKIVIVDATEKNIGGLEVKANVVIDHHRVEASRKEEEYDYIKIDHVGSCATLVTELIREEEMEFELSDSDKIIATGLLLGIATDTNNLVSENTKSRDDEAHSYLRAFIDSQKLSSIMNYPLPQYLLDMEVELMKNGNYTKVNASFIGFAGTISAAKRDALPMLADKMIRTEGITTSIIFAVVGDSLHACIRSGDKSLNVDEFAKKIFGKNAGGKLGAGAGVVPLGYWAFNNDPEDVQEFFEQAIKAKMFHVISEEIQGN